MTRQRLTAALAASALGLTGWAPLLAAPGSEPVEAEADGGSVTIAPADAFKALPVPDRTFAMPLDIAQFFSEFTPMASEGAADFKLTSRRLAPSPPTMVMQFSVSGYADDSVKGTQWRIAYQAAGAGWRVVEAGERFECYRSEHAGAWQKEPCP